MISQFMALPPAALIRHCHPQQGEPEKGSASAENKEKAAGYNDEMSYKIFYNVNLISISKLLLFAQ